MNLISDPWIPIKRQKGTAEFICPWQVTDQIQNNPIISLDYQRADFNGAMVQFLIGLFQSVFMPNDPVEWKKYWLEAPSSEVLYEACKKYTQAFNFDGDGPRFMQDLELSETSGEPKSISGLLIDEPGEQTLKNNADLFVKRNQKKVFSLTQAAAALFALHLNAPSGGAGHRTSLRGGGPLTTLLIPNSKEHTLWKLIWLNIIPKNQTREFYKNSKYDFDDEDVAIEDIFPWMAKTRTSEKDRASLPKDAHWLQMYWAMPRRIKLRFFTSTIGTCDLSGETNQPLIGDYVTQNYGANYILWNHTLSPHYKSKQDWLPVHPNLGGMSYRHWLGWTFGRGQESDKSVTKAAFVITQHGEDRFRRGLEVSLWSFGYDMDNMKARGFQESKMPVFYFDEEDPNINNVKKYFVDRLSDIVAATEEIARNTKSAVKSAWAVERGDAGVIESEFWQTTESKFYEMVRNIKARLESDPTDFVSDLKNEWHSTIHHVSIKIFERWVFSSDMTLENTERIVKARQDLENYNHSKKIKGWLDLSVKSKKESKNG